MKVIKKGNEIIGTMRVTCKTCKAELEIQARDLKKYHCYGRVNPIAYYYKCPCCRHKNYLSCNDLTEELLSDLLN